jgi:hypothetical protein
LNSPGHELRFNHPVSTGKDISRVILYSIVRIVDNIESYT